MSDRSRPEVDESEMNLKTAIAADLHEMTGEEDLMILDYVVVAKVLDADGDYGTRYTLTDSASISDVLGWLRYATVVFETKLADNVRRIDRGD